MSRYVDLHREGEGSAVAAIKQANGLVDDVIGLGQKLVLPAAGTATASEKTTEVFKRSR